MDATAAPDDAPAPAPGAPRRRTAGVAPHREPRADAPDRFAATPRYPAMFHVAGGRLVWDGTRLRHVRGDGTLAATAGRPVVTVTGPGPAGPTVVVTWPTGHHTPPAASARPSRAVLLDRSADRFRQFARALADTHPGALVLDDRTVASARVPRLRPGTPGSAARPGVFARAVWRGPTDPGETTSRRPGTSGGADLVDRLERLAALHRDGALTDDEYARAKAHLLG
ncbi:SHOCT domain-containing protein [Cellulosimicrobium sp. NPDC057127]|uniref:SHOCT domain-containing protein n=1 Tax=Cellulosimicrobium sp. NPDC057127 TaxID=3346026 RepID=UPI003640BF22